MTYLPLALSIACAFLWVYFAVPITLRLLGLHVPIAFHKRLQILRELGLFRFLSIYGVLTCGMSFFIQFASDRFLEWRFSAAWELGLVPSPFNSAQRMAFIFFTYVALGVFLGWFGWKPGASRI